MRAAQATEDEGEAGGPRAAHLAVIRAPTAGQPMPESAQIMPVPAGTVIVRTWQAGEPERCGFCPGRPCCALPGGNGIEVCTLFVPGWVASERAALWILEPPLRGTPKRLPGLHVHADPT
jgi:hypothetical protein